QPDARYRLHATAEVRAPDFQPPWANGPRPPLILEQEFSTVRAPVLMGPPEPIVLRRDEPLELRYSQPLADARVTVPGVDARTEIASGDPRIVRIQLMDIAPGQEWTVHLSGVVGGNGAPGAERDVQIRTPDPVQLVSINGAQPQDRVAVPLD